MNIAVLGGAFDPPHIGHLIVASQIRTHLDLDEVWFMPVGSHPFEKHLSPALHRLEMCKLLENDFITATDFEIKKPGKSYTIETIRALEKAYPGDTFYWCIGSDMLPDFHKWHEWQTLLNQYNLVVYPRGVALSGFRDHVLKTLGLEKMPEKMIVMDSPETIVTNISSTLVRRRIGEGKSIDYLMPERVKEYIEKNKLYKYKPLR